MNNIGVSFVKMNKYDEAISTFESCMEEKPDFRAGLNLILCANTLEDREKMREGFQRLLDIPLEAEDEDKYVSHSVSFSRHENCRTRTQIEHESNSNLYFPFLERSTRKFVT